MSKYEIKCECGATVRSRTGPHYTSVGHLQASRIKALLGEPCITYTEIGHRLGLSYERVRQYARKFNMNVENRRDICYLEQFKHKNKALDALAEKCSKHGLELELVRTPCGTVSKSQVMIEGRTCGIQKMTWHKTAAGKSYLSIKRPKFDGDFIIWYLLTDDLWLIVPKDLWPQGQTMFAIDPAQPGADTVRHDWASYLDAWHLLENRRGVDGHQNLSPNAGQSFSVAAN